MNGNNQNKYLRLSNRHNAKTNFVLSNSLLNLSDTVVAVSKLGVDLNAIAFI